MICLICIPKAQGPQSDSSYSHISGKSQVLMLCASAYFMRHVTSPCGKLKAVQASIL